jgi:hypothetical protein
MPLYWPGTDKWPPPRWVWGAALAITIVAFGLVLIAGAVGAVIYVVFLVICLVLGANQRLKNIGAQDFWNSRPKD